MLIGIDLDNTLIDYTDAFLHGAHELDLVPENWTGHKLELQQYICSSSGGERNWQKYNCPPQRNHARHGKTP